MKYKLLKIANELNDLIMHSKEHIKCEFSTGECKNEVKVFLFHYSDRYKNNCEIITFFEHYEGKNILENFELAKKVIKGECLINAEFIWLISWLPTSL